MSNPYAPPSTGGGDGPPDGQDAPPAPPAHGSVPQPGPQRVPQPDRQPGRQPGPQPGPAGRTGNGEPPPGRPTDPAAVQLMSRRMGVFALLMVATLVALALPLPFGAAALAFALGAVVVGIRAMAAARRAGARSAMVLLGVAVGFSTLLVVNVVTMLVLWDLQVAQQECLGRALTTSAREACAAEFQQGLDRRLDELRSRAGR